MKKKILIILSVTLLASAGVFAATQQKSNYQDGVLLERQERSLFEEVSDGMYKNVETGEVVSSDELPEYCRIVGGEGQALGQRRENSEGGRFLNRDDSNFRQARPSNKGGKGMPGGSPQGGPSSRNFGNVQLGNRTSLNNSQRFMEYGNFERHSYYR